MNYPYQITSFEQYQADYAKSIEQPENFGAILPNILFGKKMGFCA
jgi:hypothetical protein